MRIKIFILTILLFLPMICHGGENIVGFDFGEVFKDHKNHKEVKGEKRLPHVYQGDNVKFFDLAQVGTNENNIIKTLAFSKEYKINVRTISTEKRKIVSDFKKILASLEKRYGSFDTIGAESH